MKLSIWVTKTCNMACSYCYEEGLIREDTGVCEIDYIEKTIEFINTMCYKTASKKIFIKFFGGEPLIKFPFIKKFVEIANEKIDDKITPFYSITTNGTLMTDDMLIWLKKNNVECALSIDGDEEIYSINRRYKNRSSAWRDVDDLIPRLFDASLKLSARVTYNSKTVSKLSSSCEYLINQKLEDTRMKIVIINGSARKGNTLTAINAFIKGASEKNEIEIIEPDKLNIAPCKGCGVCQCSKGCVDKDDTNPTIDKIAAADMILFATPVYWWGMSAQLKLIIDKCYCRGLQLKNKKVGTIVVGGSPVDSIQYELIDKQFDCMAKYLSWDMLFKKSYYATARDELEKNKDSMNELEGIGKDL